MLFKRSFHCRFILGEENIRRIEENGITVMVTEHRVLDDRRQGHILIKVRVMKWICDHLRHCVKPKIN